MKTLPLSDLVATAEPLRRWLESLPPDEVAGEQKWTRSCPVARFIGERHWWPIVDVDGSLSGQFAWVREVGRPYPDQAPLSPVLLDFVKRVDRSRAKRLTAKHCLALLDRAEREVGG